MAAPCSDNKQNYYHHQVHHHQGQGTLLQFRLEVPFPSAAEATLALRSLQPDREPRAGRGVSKELAVSGSVLSGQWSADEARTLRVSVSSFLDHLTLVLETMEAFGPPVCARSFLNSRQCYSGPFLMSRKDPPPEDAVSRDPLSQTI